MREEDLKRRLRSFALRILKLIDSLPHTVAGRAIANQLVKPGTSVAANYRALLAGESRAQILSQNRELLKRKMMKANFGSK
jgi:four helix bundle protein